MTERHRDTGHGIQKSGDRPMILDKSYEHNCKYGECSFSDWTVHLPIHVSADFEKRGRQHARYLDHSVATVCSLAPLPAWTPVLHHLISVAYRTQTQHTDTTRHKTVQRAPACADTETQGCGRRRRPPRSASAVPPTAARPRGSPWPWQLRRHHCPPQRRQLIRTRCTRVRSAW